MDKLISLSNKELMHLISQDYDGGMARCTICNKEIKDCYICLGVNQRVHNFLGLKHNE